MLLIFLLAASEEEFDEEFEEEYQGTEDTTNEIGVLQQVLRHRRENEDGEDYNYEYFEEDY